MNKKVIIPLFASAMGLSLLGGISGAVAWYQYNSRVSASFLGASVADTGVLQIGTMEMVDDDNDPETPKVEQYTWGRDLSFMGEKANLIPVTFGAMGANNALPPKAYAYPESGAGEGYTQIDPDLPGWVEAKEGEHYAQFEFYLRAYQTDDTEAEGYKLVARDVFLSNVILASVTDDKVAEDALRVHIAVENQSAMLLAKDKIEDDSSTTDANEALPLFGGLDLDKNGHNDKYHGTVFNDNLKKYGVQTEGEHTGEAIHAENEEIVYGVSGQYQETKALLGNDSIVQERDADGKMPRSTDAGYENKILTTSASGAVKVTVTVWLEGWAILKTGESTESNVWNPYYSAGTDVQLGLQFDTGIFRGADLN